MGLLGLKGLNGNPFIHRLDGNVDIGAYPTLGNEPFSPASGISGKSFTRKDAERELKAIYAEFALEHLAAEELQRSVEAERKLTPQQRAERDLKLAEAHCVDCEKTFERNPLKLNHDRLVDARADRDRLTEHIEELHEQEVLDRISRGEKITDPKIAKQLAAANRELIKLKGDKKHQRRIDQLNTEIYRLRLHG